MMLLLSRRRFSNSSREGVARRFKWTREHATASFSTTDFRRHTRKFRLIRWIIFLPKSLRTEFSPRPTHSTPHGGCENDAIDNAPAYTTSFPVKRTGFSVTYRIFPDLPV